MKHLITAIALVLAFGPVHAQTKAPDTPAGQTLAGWIHAVNSGDRETMRAFHLAHSDQSDAGRARADRHAGMDEMLYKRSGGIDLVRVVRATDTEIEAEIAGRGDGGLLAVTFTVSAAPPHVIERGAVRPLQ